MSMSQKYIELQIDNPNEAVMLLGMSDANITLIEETYGVQIITRGEVIQIAGENEEKKKLKEIRKIVSEREINTSSHNRNSCAISKLITYIENGYSSKEFMHDALLAKKYKTHGK